MTRVRLLRRAVTAAQCLVIDGRFADELYMAMILVRSALRGRQ